MQKQGGVCQLQERCHVLGGLFFETAETDCIVHFSMDLRWQVLTPRANSIISQQDESTDEWQEQS